MKPGPPKKSATLKFLPGNDPSQRKTNNGKTTMAGDKAPSCPKWLTMAAKVEWKRLIPILQKMGICSSAYRSALAAYCQCYARWKQAEQMTDEKGLTVETPNGMDVLAPWVSVARQSRRDMLKYMAEFGLTPASRLKVLGESDADQAADDEFEAYLASKPVNSRRSGERPSA